MPDLSQLSDEELIRNLPDSALMEVVRKRQGGQISAPTTPTQRVEQEIAQRPKSAREQLSQLLTQGRSLVPNTSEVLQEKNPFAKSVEATAYRPDGTAEVLIWAKNRRLDWEPIYYFRNPVELPKGTRIEVIAYLDNSAENPNNPHDPPRAIQFAEGLCDLFLAQSVDLR